jgi:hypothetical protein
MTAYVIKSWYAENKPDAGGNYVSIDGRAGGFMSWFLNLLNISPTVRLALRGDKILFQKGSLEGMQNFITPLENICSTFYSFKRPAKEAVVIGVLLGALTFFLLAIPGIVVAVLYYVLNKTLTIGFTDLGGRAYEIPFKRSVMEGQVIEEAQAARVCEIMQQLVDASRHPSKSIAATV